MLGLPVTRDVHGVSRGRSGAEPPAPRTRGKYFRAGCGQSHLEEVFLDGARLALCHEAREGIDGGEGWAHVLVTDPAGDFQRDTFGNIKTAVLHGRVEIRAVN